jgi:hypothetical protein
MQSFVVFCETSRPTAVAQEAAPPPAADSGEERVRHGRTLVRIKRRAFFDEIDQAQLAASAGIKLPPSQFSAVQDGCGADWAG